MKKRIIKWQIFFVEAQYRIDEFEILESFEKRDRILDVGCGWGRLIVAQGIKINYTGVDQSSASLKIAKKNL